MSIPILPFPILFQEHNDFFHMVDMDITAKISESQKKASFYFDKKGSINSKNNTPLLFFHPLPHAYMQDI